MAYQVTQRRREMTLRRVLGASSGSVLRLVLMSSLRLTLTGAVLGLAGALVIGRAVSTLLFGVSPFDPFVVGGATGLIVLTALGAALAPAFRASRGNLTEALRSDE
jgi:ABC-type antimicrobial peptide transport system permease subunit